LNGFPFYFCSAGKIYALPLLSASSSALIPKLLLNKYPKKRGILVEQCIELVLAALAFIAFYWFLICLLPSF